MSRIIWVDEEVGSFGRAIRWLIANSVEVVKIVDATEALNWHRDAVRATGVANTQRLLVLDMMLAPGEDRTTFSRTSTESYYLTGKRLVEEIKDLASFTSYDLVVIYTALADPNRSAALEEWIASWNSSKTPKIELRRKDRYRQSELAAQLLQDLGRRGLSNAQRKP